MTIVEWCVLITGVVLAWPLLFRSLRTLYSVIYTSFSCWTRVKITVRDADGNKRSKTAYVENYPAFIKELKENSVKTSDGKGR